MDQVKQDEFLAILDAVANIPRPRLDYSTLNNANFAGCQFIRRLMEVQAFFMAFFRATGNVPVDKEGMKDILVKSMNLTPLSLAAIYHATSDGPLVGLLADLIIEELFIGMELGRRLADKRIGTVLILAPFFSDISPSEQWLAKELKVDKVKAYRPWIQDENDIKQDSLLRAFELAANLKSPTYAPGPLPPFPLELRPVEASFWNVGLAKVWRNGHESLRKGLIPVLEEEAERFPGQVRDDQREEWKKIARRKKILNGTEKFPTKGPDAWRADWDFSKTVAEGRRKEIEPKVHARISNPEDSALEVENLREKELLEAHAYKIAMKRAGKKGTIYLDELKAGKTNIDAAQAAGIHRRTGERIKEVIRQSQPSETLKKTRR